MATDQSTVDFLLDQLSALGEASARKMFGEYCLYLSGKPVGLVCDDQLYLKPTTARQAMLPEITEGLPYPGAKPHLLITPDQWEDAEWLCGIVRATARELRCRNPRPESRSGNPCASPNVFSSWLRCCKAAARR